MCHLLCVSWRRVSTLWKSWLVSLDWIWRANNVACSAVLSCRVWQSKCPNIHPWPFWMAASQFASPSREICSCRISCCDARFLCWYVDGLPVCLVPSLHFTFFVNAVNCQISQWLARTKGHSHSCSFFSGLICYLGLHRVDLVVIYTKHKLGANASFDLPSGNSVLHFPNHCFPFGLGCFKRSSRIAKSLLRYAVSLG